MIAALIGGAYFLYRKFSGATDAAAKGIADAYVRVTSGPGVQVLAKIVLPSGQRIDATTVAVKSDFTFAYGGKRYRLTKRRPDNDYDSVLAGLR